MPYQNDQNERISRLRSSLNQAVNYLWGLARQSPAKSAVYMSLIVALSVAVTRKINQIREEQPVTPPIEEINPIQPNPGINPPIYGINPPIYPNPGINPPDRCRVYRYYPSYQSYGSRYNAHYVPNPGCYVRPPIGYPPYDLYNQEYRMKRCLSNIEDELNAKHKRDLIAAENPSENIICAKRILSLRNIWFVEEYPEEGLCQVTGEAIPPSSPGLSQLVRRPPTTLGRLTYAEKRAKLNQCQQTLRMARSGHYRPPEDPLAFPMKQCVEEVENLLHDRHKEELIAEGARPTSVYCPGIYANDGTREFSAPLPVKGDCYIEEPNQAKRSFGYLANYRFLFSDEQKQNRLERCQNQLATLDPLRGQMQKCVQLLMPLKKEKLKEDLIAKGVNPANIRCRDGLSCSTDADGNIDYCGSHGAQYGNWRMDTKVGCYDTTNPPSMYSTGLIGGDIDESGKQYEVDACETELAALQGGSELQERMAQCLLNYADILNRKSKADLHEGGTDDSDIICRSDIPTQSHKVWLVDYEKFKDYSKCALKTDDEPLYPYDRDANNVIPDDTQKQALLSECEIKLAEAEQEAGDLPETDRLAESMKECKQSIRAMENTNHRAELIAQGSRPDNIVCHDYPSGEEPLWDVNTWSDCYDETLSERTPLPYNWNEYNQRGEVTDNIKHAWLNRCDRTLAELRQMERNRTPSGEGSDSVATGLR